MIAALWRRLRGDRLAVLAIAILGLIVLAALFGPLLGRHALDHTYLDRVSEPPNFHDGFYFGTDMNGRDLFTRTLYGARISLLVGVCASLISLAIGVTYGTIAGYFGGRLDNLMMRVVDVLYSLPFIFFVILLTVYFGRGIILVFVAIGAVQWLDMARIVRGQTMTLKHREFVEAARAFGASHTRILIYHILPNLSGAVIACVMLVVPNAILTESFLSFLGLGVQEPLTSWGVLIGDGANNLISAPWSLFFPASFMAATLLALNIIGDKLRDLLDPRALH